MKVLLFIVHFLLLAQLYSVTANRAATRNIGISDKVHRNIGISDKVHRNIRISDKVRVSSWHKARRVSTSFDLFSSLDKARSALLSFYDPAKPTRPHRVKVTKLKNTVLGNKGAKGATGGKSWHKKFAKIKSLSLKPLKPIPMVVKTKSSKYVIPISNKRPTSLSTNKYAEALEDIEKALVDAQEAARITTYDVRRLTRLQKLIKTAVSKRSYRFARKAIGEALFTIAKLKEKRWIGRRKRQIVLSNEDFLGNVRKTIGAQAFADLLAMQGQVTLTFAIDTTGSMGNEIDASKKIVQSIANQSRDEPVDYILSPFNDPVNGAVQYFEEDRYDSFVQALNKINVDGGGDCPELTFKGMMDAINVGQPFSDSPMYVFTDAGAKDGTEDNIKQLTQLAKAEDIVINFFVAYSSCTKISDMSPFEKVAQETTGQVFRLKDANELKQLADLTGNSLGGTAVISTANNNIISYRRKRSNSKQVKRYKIPVDDSIDTLVISVTMDKPKTTSSFWDVSLTSPSGKITSVTEKLQKNVIYQLSNPTVGDWILQITSDNSVKYDFYAKASSANNIDFEYYFVKKNRRSLLVPISNPVKGQQAQAILTVGGVDNIDKTSLQAELVTTTGRTTNQAISIKKEDTRGVRYSLTFTPPGNIFKIKLKGKTNQGNSFERISHNFIHSETVVIKVLYAKNDYTVPAGKSTYIMFTVENQGDSESVELAAFGSLGLIESTSRKTVVIRKGRRTSFTVNFKADSKAEKGITITIVASVKGKNSGSKATTSVPLLVV